MVVRMARHGREARRSGAKQVPAQGLKRVAEAHGVHPETVRGWCKEFNVDLAARPAAAAASLAGTPTLRPAPLSDSDRQTLRNLRDGISTQLGGWTNQGAFAPEAFTARLARAAREHRRLETPQQATAGMVSVVDDLNRVCDAYAKAGDSDAAGCIQGHAEQLKAIVEACVLKAETRGPDGALRLLNDALENWGATGVDPEHLTQRGTVPVWEQRRRKAEDAVTRLGPMLRAHPEYESHPGYTVRRGRYGSRVIADARFDKHGRDIFATPGVLAARDWDHPDLVGRDVLIEMAQRAAAAAGLEIGTEAEVDVTPQEKGWVSVGFRITAPG